LRLSSLQVVRRLPRPAQTLVVGALWLFAIGLQGCPQQLTDDFSIERPDAAPVALDCAPFDACSGACVDLASDASHCGECDAAVDADEICSRGTPIDAESGCGARRLCDRGCVDVQTHTLHCGACGVRCERGERCMMGRCECPPGTRDCGSVCSECCSSNDCAGDERCSEGACALSCTLPSVACMDRCVDVQSDAMHCGRCRNDCGPMGMCVDGTCMRP